MRRGDRDVKNYKVKQVVDVDGNVEREEVDYSYRLPVEPEFVKMYVDDVASLNGITGVHRAVLCFMASLMDYDNKVVLSPAERKRWQKELGVAQSTLNNSISSLMHAGHIRREGPGEYIVCPAMFSKGDWKKTMQKRVSFDAYFKVEYRRTSSGYTRTLRTALVKPIGMKIDPETGEVLYKYKRGGEFEQKRHDESTTTEQPPKNDDDNIPY